MAIRKIHEVGDPCLAKVCRPVTEFNDRLHELLDDMADTLEEAGGVGLAAPQVGILRRVCIVEDEQGEIIELITPEIIKTEGAQTGHEGCLSVPGKTAASRARWSCACARRTVTARSLKLKTKS